MLSSYGLNNTLIKIDLIILATQKRGNQLRLPLLGLTNFNVFAAEL